MKKTLVYHEYNREYDREELDVFGRTENDLRTRLLEEPLFPSVDGVNQVKKEASSVDQGFQTDEEDKKA